jgi:YjbE family integral membrane protein
MTTFAEPQFWGRFFEIAFLNLLLSGDNAVLIALAVRALPGRQRMLGLVWGTIAAVVLRIVFVGLVTWLLQVPFLRVVGAVLLYWIAFKLVTPAEDEGAATRHGSSLWEAIWLILVADITMSLDNVLAIAGAARGNITLVFLGIATSVPIVIGGSGILARLMARHAWVVWVGGGLLGYVAGDMLLEDPVVIARLGAAAETLEYPVAITAATVLTLYGWWRNRRSPRRAAR